jgi:arginine/ornithine N-succinyltransferase beta subunit
VKKAGNGEVKVFRVELEGARAEYYVVSVDKEEGRVVGLKALSVES